MLYSARVQPCGLEFRTGLYIMGILRLLTLFIHLLIPSLNPGILPHLNENQTPTGNVATIEIHYHAPEAGLVSLKWGINDWQPVAEDLRPGVDLDDASIMSIPMRREDETFIAEIRVPVGSAVQYGFSIKETADGRAVDVWDNGTSSQNDSSNVQPILIAIRDAVFDVQSAVSLIVTQTFHYRNPEAGEVELVWGINGWNTVPYAADAADTIVDDDLMRTQMARNGDVFEASIELPNGSHIDYGFSFVKEGDTGDAERIWDGTHAATAKDGGLIVTQTFHYRNPEASEVELVWGLNEWRAVSGTADEVVAAAAEDNKRTQMVATGDGFQASIQAPLGSHINYGFLLAKQGDTGDIERTWDGDYVVAAEDGGILEVDPRSTPVEESPDNASGSFFDEPPTLSSLFMEHWPLLLVGVIIALGLLIGIKR